MHKRTTTKIFGRGNNYIAADSNPGGSLLEIAPLQAKQDNKRFLEPGDPAISMLGSKDHTLFGR